MALQNMHNQDMNLVLSSDAKPRLKWTPELHQRFVDAVTQLGGPEKATPKSLMRVMAIQGLTLYHLKSHLQACSKYRLGKSQQSESYSEDKQEAAEYGDNQRSHFSFDYSEGAQNQINESLQIAQALEMQMEVQRKLYEQIEVQRHLQLRIEAQGKYLQSVLKKAQDTLAGYSSSSAEVEAAKAELSQLVSMVDTTSSISALTETGGLSPKEFKTSPLIGTGCSLESSLTSSESSGRKEEAQRKQENDRNSVVLSLMEMRSGEKSGSSNQNNGRKRSGSTISDGNCKEQPWNKRSPNGESGKFGSVERLDLNSSQYVNEFDTFPKGIDLNCNGHL
ncbi:hypothetical protein LguiB_024927 [Lonicera macranthoides]